MKQSSSQLNNHDSDAAFEAALTKKIAPIRSRVKPDRSFAIELRETLSTKASGMQISYKPLTLFSYMQKFVLPLVLVAVVAAAGGYYVSQRNNNVAGLRQLTDSLVKADYAVSELPANSFGSLVTLATANNTAGGRGAGGGAGLTAFGGGTEAATPTADSKMIVDPGTGGGGFVPEYYEFDYKGESFGDLLSAQQPVFKRNKIESNTDAIESALRSFTFGLIDLSKLDNASLQNFSISQPDGFDVYVDFREQTVNMYKNGNYYIMNSGQCGPDGSNCPQLTIDDIPGDDVITAATNAFLDQYQVSRSGYGAPVVDKQWRRAFDYPEATNYSRYIPEVISVVYPYEIDGKITYEEGGYFSGMFLTYNVRTKEVNSLSNLRLRQYQKSEYTGETQEKRLLEIAERGGFRNYPYVDANARKVVLRLGTPTVQMMNFWKYDQATPMASQELFVPALVFPIENPGNYWRTNVVVPLVTEVLDGENYQPQPMPLGGEKPIPVDIGGGAATLERKE